MQIARSPRPEAAEAVTLVGWAEKPGYDNRKLRRRFCRLDAHSLRYYKTDSASTPQGIIELSAFCVAAPAYIGDRIAANATAIPLTGGDAKINKPFGLSLVVPESDRTYYFYCSSTRERLAWVQAINTNADALRRVPGKLDELVSLLSLLDASVISSAERGLCKTLLRRRFAPLPEAVPNTVLANAFRGVAEDDVGALATALDADTGIARACTSDGVSLLMEAALHGHTALVHMLLQPCTDVNLADIRGDTALILAARHGHAAVVKLLLQHSADVTRVNRFQETALTEAEHTSAQIRDMLVAAAARPPPPQEAPSNDRQQQPQHPQQPPTQTEIAAAEQSTSQPMLQPLQLDDASIDAALQVQLESLQRAHASVKQVLTRMDEFRDQTGSECPA